jgi:flagellar motility protein MotE (MotC chaperone)
MRYLLIFIVVISIITSIDVTAKEEEQVTSDAGVKGPIIESDQFSKEDYLGLLEEREKRLNTKEEEIRKEEETLRMLKLGIEEDIKRYSTLKSEIQKDLIKLDKEREERFNKLVKIYEIMGPGEAATRLIKMDESTAIKLISMMKEKVAGKILGQMEPSRAARISEKIVKEKTASRR